MAMLQPSQNHLVLAKYFDIPTLRILVNSFQQLFYAKPEKPNIKNPKHILKTQVDERGQNHGRRR